MDLVCFAPHAGQPRPNTDLVPGLYVGPHAGQQRPIMDLVPGLPVPKLWRPLFSHVGEVDPGGLVAWRTSDT